MKTSFAVVLQKNQADGLVTAITIAEFNLQLRISSQHEVRWRAGYRPFVQALLIAILHKRERQHLPIAGQRFVDSLLASLMDRKQDGHLNPHDLPLEIEVDFQSRHHWRFFTRALPTFTGLLVVVEAVASTIVSIGTLQMTENFLPLSARANQVLTITQSVLATVFGLCLSFSSTGMAFMGDLGVTVDEALLKVWHRLTCQHWPEEQASSDSGSLSRRGGIWLCQLLCVLLALNYQWTDVIQDYQEISLLKNQIIALQDGLLPPVLVEVAAWVSFGANQWSDPLQLLTFVMLGFAWIRLCLMPRQQQLYQQGETLEWLEGDVEAARLEEAEAKEAPSASVDRGLSHLLRMEETQALSESSWQSPLLPKAAPMP